MPLLECTLDGKPGYKFGASGTCYVHDGSQAGKDAAKKKAIKQAVAIGGGKAPKELEADDPLVADALREYDELETVDLPGVEIMAAGGPYRGIGSPPEGDHYTADDLQKFVAAAADLSEAGMRPPAKIGHEATAPRVGWLDKIRMSEKGDAIVADIRDVPRKFASLVRAGAYRARSPEFYKVTNQKTGKVYDEAIGALAWLGARRPAIQRLSDFDIDEVFALYESLDGEFVRAYEFDNAEPAVPEDLLEAIVGLAERAFATSEAGATAALRQMLAAAATYLAAEPETADKQRMQSVVATLRALLAKDVADAGGKTGGAAVTRAKMAYTEEQRKQFAEATGLEEAKVTDEILAAAGVAEPDTKPKTGDADGDKTRQLEEKVEKLSGEVEAQRKRAFEAEKRAAIEPCLKDGRVEPGQRETWEKLYEADPEGTVKALAALKPNETLAKEYGSSDDGKPEDEDAKLMRLYEADAAERLGVAPEDVAGVSREPLSKETLVEAMKEALAS